MIFYFLALLSAKSKLQSFSYPIIIDEVQYAPDLISYIQLIGVSYKTVKRWLSILETRFIIYTLRPYHKNYNKRIIKSPKLYFYDTGLACALMNIRTPEQYQIHFAKGALYENFIINEVYKQFLNKGERPSYSTTYHT